MDDSNLIHEMVENVNFMIERMDELEKKSIKIAVFLESFERKLLDVKMYSKNHVVFAFRELESLNKRLDNIHLRFKSLTPKLKFIVKNHEFEKLKTKIDKFKFEKILTLKELEKYEFDNNSLKFYNSNNSGLNDHNDSNKNIDENVNEY